MHLRRRLSRASPVLRGQRRRGACDGITCSDHGQCIVQGQEPTCVCEAGYTEIGLACLDPYSGDGCRDVDCSGHGTCALVDDRAVCSCEEGYHAQGTKCVLDVPADPCDGVSCAGHGTCDASAGAPACACDAGFHAAGLNCVEDVPVDPCQDVSCSGHGTCNMASAELSCLCDDGYHADGLNCIEDPAPHPCEGVTCGPHGECKVVEGAAACVCEQGFHDEERTCVEDQQVDPCTGVTCSGHGSCAAVEGTPACACASGFHAEGLACLRDDPCIGVSCGPHGECKAFDDGPSCACDEGFHADGLTCARNDPCVGISCGAHGVCTPVDDAASCACDTGYHAEGLSCVKDDPCKDITCGPHGHCVPQGEAPDCACDPGYHADGLACVVDVDPCEGQTCSGHGSCTVVDGAVSCQCEDGHSPVGLSCIQGSCQSLTRRGSVLGGPMWQCIPGRHASRCDDDGGAFYKFEDGPTFRAYHAAFAYCQGHTDGTEDGQCSGLARACVGLDYEACGAQSACGWNGKVCLSTPGCSEGWDSERCERMAGCYWTAPDLERLGECGSVAQYCEPDRRYRFCADGRDGYYLFEDGMTLRGDDAAEGYCAGQTDGNEDGTCAGIPPACSTLSSQATCDAARTCAWREDRGICGIFSAPRCYGVSPETCSEPGCYWAPVFPHPENCAGALYDTCVKSRRYWDCFPPGDGPKYYLFEDGKRFYGSSAALAYCRGDADGSEDGNCEGSGCAGRATALSCAAKQECTWVPGEVLNGKCTGTPSRCSSRNRASCLERQECTWVPNHSE